MLLDKKWFKENALCKEGLIDLKKNKMLGKSIQELYDFYINRRPDWVVYNSWHLIDDDILRLKYILKFIEEISHLIVDEKAKKIIDISKEMVTNGKIVENKEVDSFFDLLKNIYPGYYKGALEYECIFYLSNFLKGKNPATLAVICELLVKITKDKDPFRIRLKQAKYLKKVFDTMPK